mmetsp:Transcript_11956/g.50294  ORF Transcript_11956/g.50294 Transcript_11956/m.50294 type:complete len:297 (-) Transcript_11956:525-1415(-)
MRCPAKHVWLNDLRNDAGEASEKLPDRAARPVRARTKVLPTCELQAGYVHHRSVDGSGAGRRGALARPPPLALLTHVLPSEGGQHNVTLIIQDKTSFIDVVRLIGIIGGALALVELCRGLRATGEQLLHAKVYVIDFQGADVEEIGKALVQEELRVLKVCDPPRSLLAVHVHLSHGTQRGWLGRACHEALLVDVLKTNVNFPAGRLCVAHAISVPKRLPPRHLASMFEEQHLQGNVPLGEQLVFAHHADVVQRKMHDCTRVCHAQLERLIPERAQRLVLHGSHDFVVPALDDEFHV